MLAGTLGAALIVFVAGSVVYVYRFRGNVRYANFKEYVRKGWPVFAPLNCLLYAFTRSKARRAIMDTSEFEDLADLRENWRTIREEAIALYEGGEFDKTNDPEASAYYDVGFRTFYKYGWSKFYLKWYGYTHDSAKRLCPETVKLLEGAPTINGAMLSVLPVGSKLTPHMDPFACSLRYHLALATPNSDACYINIDGRDYSWRDGQDLLFDETYMHYAHNDADQYRLILMCDVERPTFLLGSIVNFVYKILMRATIVPNTSEDKRGLANRVFAGVKPVLDKGKALKGHNRTLYRLVKFAVNVVLLALVIAAVAGIGWLLYEIFAPAF